MPHPFFKHYMLIIQNFEIQLITDMGYPITYSRVILMISGDEIFPMRNIQFFQRGDIITERTTLDRADVEELFLEAKTKDAAYARANGIIDEIRELQIPPRAPITQLIFKR